MPSVLTDSSSEKQTRLCPGCELAVDIVDLKRGSSAYCPRCNSHLYQSRDHSLNGNLALALTCLLLFIPSHFFPFITIRLFGVTIPATILDGPAILVEEGFMALGILVVFCASLAPFLVCLFVVLSHVALHQRWFSLLKTSTFFAHHLKHWVMIDVFLASIAISCFKLQDYSDIFVGWGLMGLIMLQVLSLILISRYNGQQYWEAWQQESNYHFDHKDVHCHMCHLSQPEGSHCERCHQPLHHRVPNSMKKTWMYLFAASVAIIPANVIPISILLTNGKRLEDTIFSGVASLVKNGMPGIALIIFVASIVVPVAKILGLAYIMLAIRFKRRIFHKQRMMIYFAVKWIGKWSMMDLFVISIMLTLVDRGQILDFTPGYGAVAFGIVVIMTMLAAESLDPRLIWDNYPNSNQDKNNNE
ncbi:paraquat-inducible protein A [Vibrio sp. SCSIO 43136]|uniref:paraquat-inducible protein A n=1 Tax=Vibrio sp. SCSIO 43136 TaxID=2819101 RepID=UPI0020756213|nr:paraquat-inducible protein A [Vibrio sp. SCSIO 43136]USD66521.1 paraquat-inducible protein A [Vibrio sp. SCSIO 43136]